MTDDDQARRAYSYAQAISAGLEPSSYDWKDVPEGEWEAKLDFKVWGKSSNLGCYFTRLDNDGKYLLNAFPRKQDKSHSNAYVAKDEQFDLAQRGLEGRKFRLKVGRNAKGNTAWLEARLLDQ